MVIRSKHKQIASVSVRKVKMSEENVIGDTNHFVCSRGNSNLQQWNAIFSDFLLQIADNHRNYLF